VEAADGLRGDLVTGVDVCSSDLDGSDTVTGMPHPSSKHRVGRAAAKRGGAADPMLGRRVRHPSYGVGTIVAVEGDDEDRRVSVSFPGRGTKKFIERYAQLEQA